MAVKKQNNGQMPPGLEIPPEYSLRDEVRWLQSEDTKMFQYLREAMNKIEPAYIATYPPTECGIATFTKDVVTSVAKYTPFSKPTVIAVRREEEIEPYERTVRFQIYRDDKNSYLEAAKYINDSTVDVVSLQHEYGIFGGDHGDYVLDLLKALKKPVVATLHTVLRDPNPEQKRIIQEMAQLCEVLVVMIKTGRQILMETYGIPSSKITVIPHGVPNVHRVSSAAVKRALGLQGKRIISTFGLINRGKGLEYVIEALPKIVEKNPNTIYLVLGETHPGVRSYEGESYRNYLKDMIHDLKLENHVKFNNRFLALNELVRYLCATDAYITPYLSKDQITSGTLAYAVGSGRAIISTPYLYAEEVLADGRGLLVDFRSPDQIAEKINLIFSDSELRESLETKAYRYGRRAAWFNVAIDYLDLFHRILIRKKTLMTAGAAKKKAEVRK